MRFWLTALGILGMVALLKTQFPYALEKPDQILRLVYLSLMALLIGSGVLGRVRATQAARDAMVWLAIILTLVLAYSFKDDLRDSRLAAALVPSRIHRTAEGGLSIEAAQDGHFHMDAEVNGVVVNFLVDTGASDIVLSPQDAQAAGYDTQTLNYSRTYSTANGMVSGAPVVIRTMSVGPFALHDVRASVNQAAMDTSLLGMAFLKQFREYTVNGDTLTLYP